VFTRYDSRIGSRTKSNMFDSSDRRSDRLVGPTIVPCKRPVRPRLGAPALPIRRLTPLRSVGYTTAASPVTTRTSRFQYRSSCSRIYWLTLASALNPYWNSIVVSIR